MGRDQQDQDQETKIACTSRPTQDQREEVALEAHIRATMPPWLNFVRSFWRNLDDERELIHQACTACTGAADFQAICTRPEFIACLDRLDYGMFSLRYETQEQMAIRWANNITDPSNEKLNADRRTAKGFFMSLCDRRRDIPPIVTEEEVRDLFERNPRLIRALKVCLLLDRANAWYNLPNHLGTNGSLGKHWVSEVHDDIPDEMREANLPSGHPINKRYIWLGEMLQLDRNDDIWRLLNPAHSPRLGYPEPEPCTVQCCRGLQGIWNCMGGRSGIVMTIVGTALCVWFTVFMEKMIE